MLDVQHIAFSFGRKHVLGDVTFSVATGEIVGVLGANGTGKTTLLKVLATCLMQDAGTISLDDIDSLATPLRYRKRIGYLPETSPLYPEMEVGEYLTYRAALKGERFLRIKRRVKEVLNLCGLNPVARSRVKNLSLGYRKRVGLADVLLRRPTLMLLDDLLPGLDAAHRKKTAEILATSAPRSAILLTGHELHELAAICTRFVLLENGTITQSLSVASLPRPALEAMLETWLSRA
ncbi:MAG: ABC transporter ATP-binding protein [Kiritimatiellae bacterium]|nr:ABC transporter ATP-binding protein [Kiritimatiellia bacterium]